jgi:hypothetical protein
MSRETAKSTMNEPDCLSAHDLLFISSIFEDAANVEVNGQKSSKRARKMRAAGFEPARIAPQRISDQKKT